MSSLLFALYSFSSSFKQTGSSSVLELLETIRNSAGLVLEETKLRLTQKSLVKLGLGLRLAIVDSK